MHSIGQGDMPTLGEMTEKSVGSTGTSVFPADAYGVIVKHLAGEPYEIPLSLQHGVSPATPIATSEDDINAMIDKRIEAKARADAEQKYAAVQADPDNAALVGDDVVDQGSTERTLDEILDDKPEPIDLFAVNASRPARLLAKTHGIDIQTVKPEKGDKVTVVDVRKLIRDSK
jgi:hypothetical protein